VYTHLGGPGWWLDDHETSDPKVGEAFLQKVTELGPHRVAVHKGFANGSEYADPIDVGPAAARHRDLSFVVYHSGFDVGNPPERAYDAKDTYGVNRLVTSVQQAGIGAGGNVYAEIGSTWRFLMSNPDQAAHVLGKLLVQFGEDNVCWGTDSIWYGAPQDQIQAFRTFQISREFQERYGYPELTPKVKAKIFGLNSARLYGVDPITTTCRIDPGDMDALRQTSYEMSGDGNVTLGPRTADQVAAVAEHEARELAT
jgi:predicted TIM-barrel fold metal-dependent hydrolase